MIGLDGQPTRGKSASVESATFMSSAKPIIFITYAHADEPEKPRGEEIQWLSFVMRFLRPAVKSGAFTMWVDRQIVGGTE